MLKPKTVFNNWTVIGPGSHGGYVLVRCRCGFVCERRLQNLESGHSKQCRSCGKKSGGEARRGPHHGDKNHQRLYSIWRGMIRRCIDQKHKSYKNYGGRGIGVCHGWTKFENFKEWATANGYTPSLKIDRRNNDKGYRPSNCRFITEQEQHNNTSKNRKVTAFGETKTIAQWARDQRCGVSERMLYWRILTKGQQPEKAMTTPLQGAWRKRAKQEFLE